MQKLVSASPLVHKSGMTKHTFRHRWLSGSFASNVIRSLLEESGYIVLPYGYEVNLPYIQQRLSRASKRSKLLDRFRSCPDLLVIDDQREELSLVEVKWRDWSQPYIDAKYLSLSMYKRYWPETVLALVVPMGHWFYAQHVSKLKPGRGRYKLSTAFKQIERIFPKVGERSISEYQQRVAKFFDRPITNATPKP